LSYYDLSAIVNEEKRLQKFLKQYGLSSSCPSECPKCGGAVGADPVIHHGYPHYRCRVKGCQKLINARDGGIMEGSHLPREKFLDFLYFWAHDCPGQRAVDMLGLSSKTVAIMSLRCRLCVANQQEATVTSLGGRGVEVEMDEAELGRKPKGLHGHKKDVKSDVIGAYDRSSGILILEIYDKLCAGEKSLRRFGPPKRDDVLPLVERWVKEGSLLFTDGAKAYVSACASLGLRHAYVDHQSGQYSRYEKIDRKLREISTQRIDGQWGNLKIWCNARYGVGEDHIWSVLKEFQWRHNLKARDPFLTLLEHIRDGYYPC